MFLLANSVDPDQTPHSVASDLGLHCLPMSQKWTLGLYGLSCDKIQAITEMQHSYE